MYRSSIMSVWVLAMLGLVLLAGCAIEQGHETDFDSLGYQTCTADDQCSFGFCNPGGFCASDCRKNEDCALYGTNMECVTYQCLEVCESNANCTFGICQESGYCLSECQTNEDCAKFGNGLICDNFACIVSDSPDGDAPDGDDSDGDDPDGDTQTETKGSCVPDLDCATHHWLDNCADRPCIDYGYQWSCNEDAVCQDNGEVDLGTGDAGSNAEAYVGVWGMMFNTAQLTTGIPIINEISTVSQHTMLTRVSRDGDKLIIESKACKMFMWNLLEEDDGSSVTYSVEDPTQTVTGGMIIPKAYWDNVSMLRHELENPPKLEAGATWDTTSTFTEVRGAVLEDLLNEDIPKLDLDNPDNVDPRVFDQDMDGYPGMTTQLTGLLNGKIFSTQRWESRLHTATILDENHIKGIVFHDNEQYEIGADQDSLVYPELSFPAFPDENLSFFHMQRMDEDATCEDAIALSKEEDGWLKYTVSIETQPNP